MSTPTKGSGMFHLSSMIITTLAFIFLSMSSVTQAQTVTQAPPSDGPFAYPGMPNTSYGPDWQDYYRVASLPYAPALPNSTFAGSVSVNRENHPNNTLFFVAFEKEAGSLTAAANERSDEPWVIWLNGGPGSSSLYGLFSEHGPLRFGLAAIGSDPANMINISTIPPLHLAVTAHNYSWHQLASIFYVDQPVGTGFSTADSTGYIADEDQMGSDFVGFLSNLVNIFPSLKTRPLYLTGESYAGMYIPYITKTIVNMQSPPVKLTKTVIGDGTLGNFGAFEEYSAPSVLQAYPQLIGFNPSTYEYFVEQYNLCGYNLTLSYPSENSYPTLRSSGTINADTSTTYAGTQRYKDRLTLDIGQRISTLQALASLNKKDVIEERDHVVIGGKKFMKRQTTTNSTAAPPQLAPLGGLNPFYECFIMEQIWDYVHNYTVPWRYIAFDVYSISDALYPAAPDDPGDFLNIPAVRTALHAPAKAWAESIRYPFNNVYQAVPDSTWGDPSPVSQTFLSDLTSHVPMVFYSGNDDSLVPHRGTELAIQNTTFGGIRGFTARPSTPFHNDDGSVAGIVHQERNVTYALFLGAGHMVPRSQPQAAYAFMRDFVLGSNTTGLVTTGTSNSSPSTTTSPPDPQYAKGVFEGSVAYTGLRQTQGSYTWAQASWDAWHSYIGTRTAPDAPVASASSDGTGTMLAASMNAGKRSGLSMDLVGVVLILLFVQALW